jgi:hypothetical protein
VHSIKNNGLQAPMHREACLVSSSNVVNSVRAAVSTPAGLADDQYLGINAAGENEKWIAAEDRKIRSARRCIL